MFSYMLRKNVSNPSDWKSGKWSQVREKSGNFEMKIEWQPCTELLGLLDKVNFENS